jgi:hypothetical protein
MSISLFTPIPSQQHSKTILTSMGLALLLSSCSGLPTGITSQVSNNETPPAKAAPLPAPKKQLPSPVRMALTIDYSGSASRNRILPLTLNHLQPLFHVLQQYGGEIALIPICSDSNRPAYRLRISEPPKMDQTTWKTLPKPTPPPDEANPFELQELVENYRQELQQYNDAQTVNANLLEQHQQTTNQWKEETQKAIQRYQEQIKPILERPATCQETDVSGAVERAELFLGEDTTIWVRPPENFLLLITDGLDTRNKTQIRLKTSPQVLVVNGTGSEGVLSEIPHKSFESNRAAFDYLKITIETGQAHEQ